MCSNYVANIFRNADALEKHRKDPTNHSWDEQGRVKWVGQCYPESVCELILAMDEKNDEHTYDNGGGRDDCEDFVEDIEDISCFD